MPEQPSARSDQGRCRGRDRVRPVQEQAQPARCLPRRGDRGRRRSGALAGPRRGARGARGKRSARAAATARTPRAPCSSETRQLTRYCAAQRLSIPTSRRSSTKTIVGAGLRSAFVEIVADAGPLRKGLSAGGRSRHLLGAGVARYLYPSHPTPRVDAISIRALARDQPRTLVPPNQGTPDADPRLVESNLQGAQRGRTAGGSGSSVSRGRPRTRLRTAGRPSRRRPRLMSPRRRPSGAAVTPERSGRRGMKLAHLAAGRWARPRSRRC